MQPLSFTNFVIYFFNDIIGIIFQILMYYWFVLRLSDCGFELILQIRLVDYFLFCISCYLDTVCYLFIIVFEGIWIEIVNEEEQLIVSLRNLWNRFQLIQLIQIVVHMKLTATININTQNELEVPAIKYSAEITISFKKIFNLILFCVEVLLSHLSICFFYFFVV